MSRRDAFDGVLAALHAAAFDDARWPEASALIDEACGIKGNMLVYGSGTSYEDVVIYLARLSYRGERNEALERKYFEEYYPQDERVPRFRALPDSRLVHVSELYTDEEKKTSAAYNEALPLSDTQDCLSVRMDGPNWVAHRLVVRRPGERGRLVVRPDGDDRAPAAASAPIRAHAAGAGPMSAA